MELGTRLNTAKKKTKNMTYILGAKCVDGIALIADRKVLFDDGSVRYRRKISNDYYPLVIAGAGPNAMLEDFESSIKPITHKPKHDPSDLIHEIEDVAWTVNNRYKNRYLSPFEVLLAIYVDGQGTLLKHVYSEGFSCNVDDYKGIGVGEPYVAGLVKHLLKTGMTVMQAAEIGYFAVRYIQEFELHNGVGVDKIKPHDKPQIYFIYERPRLREDVVSELTDETILNKFEDNAKRRVERIESSISDSYSNIR